ncbi:uncharacterized protein Z520_01107 [Fonsecaea multimorphosa CBS 102226]|uniref:Uncharacterized protein n=1 Tax=Fonsecaea multimorphosa CBS 102226 TaxID=1442371 RepID=A0A0D2IZW1_9EURO|nr:uncharacterized protein Z520_01107 [Fonsecaea multimorphosa CBS 102226]KIY02642.1 hypothetical protein Z520_01107 [Fonsecaea multimorphosa CBS 102226]OAL31505.1 hypothetical protein AYO22_01097 [Fonsecaea multimorphosa]
MASAFAFLETPNRGVPDRRHSTEHLGVTSTSLSRNSSSASLSSRKSEPGWFGAMNNVDRSRSSSVPVHNSTKPPSGLSKLFGRKEKKEKKDMDHFILTSRHAAAVKTKLALDPKYKNVRRDSAPAERLAGSQNIMHISAGELEMRHPHSGSPALHAARNKTDLPALTRIISGDEADEPDEWEKMRDQWRQRKVPTLDTQIIEGQVLGNQSSGQSTPAEKGTEVETSPPQVTEPRGSRTLSATDDEYQPRPARTHTPIGGRWKKDEKGVWKR